MKTQEWTFHDRTGWPNGPWDNEVDKVQFTDEATGLPCLAVRNNMGNWCGYVGVTKDHPAFKKHYSEVDVSIHGGLTFSDFCQENREEGICHTVEAGEDDHVWWQGFDCAHAGDLIPVMDSGLSRRFHESYKDLNYVREECRKLAAQLKEMK